ncbi:MAG TPA: hypothetical protein VNO70_11700 [Blastocatellia bacterium]|nr:hypothetical protein [Blastocatellia bacterium]
MPGQFSSPLSNTSIHRGGGGKQTANQLFQQFLCFHRGEKPLKRFKQSESCVAHPVEAGVTEKPKKSIALPHDNFYPAKAAARLRRDEKIRVSRAPAFSDRQPVRRPSGESVGLCPVELGLTIPPETNNDMPVYKLPK